MNEKRSSNSTVPSHPPNPKLESKINSRNTSNKGDRYNLPNPAQLRRSPRKKMSTTSMINAAYRTGGVGEGRSQKTSARSLAADGASSLCSGDTNSVISDKKSLPSTNQNDLKHGKGENGSMLTMSERGDASNNQSTRSLRLTEGGEVGSSKVNQAKKAANLQADQAFLKKLRNAVYDALIGKNIEQGNKLFRPCFKKLFDICMMYGKDLAKNTNRAGSTTSQLLNKIAQQNVDSVINLEKTLFGEDTS